MQFLKSMRLCSPESQLQKHQGALNPWHQQSCTSRSQLRQWRALCDRCPVDARRAVSCRTRPSIYLTYPRWVARVGGRPLWEVVDSLSQWRHFEDVLLRRRAWSATSSWRRERTLCYISFAESSGQAIKVSETICLKFSSWNDFSYVTVLTKRSLPVPTGIFPIRCS